MQTIQIMMDISELRQDMESIEAGKLSLPTVSAVKVLAGDKAVIEMPIYIDVNGEVVK